MGNINCAYGIIAEGKEYSYYNCCGEFKSGTSIVGQPQYVYFDLNQPSNNIFLLEEEASYDCSTPTPTPTQTPTPTPTPNNLSSFVVGCCDEKIYKLQSNQKLQIGTTFSLLPNYFCYTVIQEPGINVSFEILNDSFTKNPADDCESSNCQPCDDFILTGNTENECKVITILDLGVTCNSVNPTINNPNSGILSVTITGGTQPYTVIWTSPNGNSFTGTTIYNQPAGTYTVTVYDKWKDLSATAQCTLVQPIDCSYSGSVIQFYTPTPTPTPTPTATPGPTPTPTPDCICPDGFTITGTTTKSCIKLQTATAVQTDNITAGSGTSNTVYGTYGFLIYNLNGYDLSGNSTNGTYAFNGASSSTIR